MCLGNWDAGTWESEANGRQSFRRAGQEGVGVGAIHLGCVDFRSADQSHFFQLTFQLLLNLHVDSFLAVSNSFCISSTDVE